MKNFLTTLACILLSAVLAVSAVCIGARNGWLRERDEALSAMTQDASAALSFESRGMDALNLHVVASRHLPQDDSRLAALRSLGETLTGSASATEKAQADTLLTGLAVDLAESLPALASVQQSPRDQVYVSSLTRTLYQGEDASLLLRRQAADFNQRLDASLTGQLAMLLGVEPIDLP